MISEYFWKTLCIKKDDIITNLVWDYKGILLLQISHPNNNIKQIGEKYTYEKAHFFLEGNKLIKTFRPNNPETYTYLNLDNLYLSCSDIETTEISLQYHFSFILANQSQISKEMKENSKENAIKLRFFSKNLEQILGWMNHLKKYCILMDMHKDLEFISRISRRSNIYTIAKYKARKDSPLSMGLTSSIIGQDNINLISHPGSIDNDTVKNNHTYEKDKEFEYMAKSYNLSSIRHNIHLYHQIKNRINEEIKLFRELNHPNMIKFQTVYEDELGNLHLVYDFIEGKTLEEYFLIKKQFTESSVIKIIISILEALVYLHEQKNIIHKNINLKNIMVVDQTDQIKIIDFGMDIMNQEKDAIMTDAIDEKYCFIAPEILQNKQYNNKADCYSVGVLLFTLLTGKLFKNNIHLHEQFYSNFIWYSISKNCQDLILKLTYTNPDHRYTSREALESSWIKNYLENSPKNSVDESIHEFLQLGRAYGPNSFAELGFFPNLNDKYESVWTYDIDENHNFNIIKNINESFNSIWIDENDQNYKNNLNDQSLSLGSPMSSTVKPNTMNIPKYIFNPKKKFFL